MESLKNCSPQLSIITINYNGLDDTLEMLQSIEAASYKDLEIIVVDNASRKDPTRIIKCSFPNVKVIRSEENLGFAGGNNLGIRAAMGKYIMLLNNDTVVDRGFAEPIIHAFENHPEVGIVGSKIWFQHSPGVVQYAGSTPLNRLTVTSFAKGWGQKDQGQFNQAGYTNLAHGAAMTVSRKAVESAGEMDHKYFLYYEELDWCLRITKAGFKTWFEPQSLIHHKESMSTGKKSPLKEYYKTRNRLLLARKHSAGITRILSLSYLTALANPAHCIKKLLKGDVSLAQAQCQGVLWHINPKKFTFKA